ncbi:hypothetical protein [Streptomyces sp. NPDC048825]|uniref:hypothetical protein n=1 Tax=Streptomyces sp. NPDC048825 TaxID=3365592 RepID=UPI003720C6CF
MTKGFSDQFLLEAERHSVWGAAQLEALMEFLPEAPWTGTGSTRRAITVATRARGHSWSSVQPCAAGPFSSSAASQARHSGFIRDGHPDRPADLCETRNRRANLRRCHPLRE